MVAAMINEDIALAELMSWVSPDDLRDGLPDLIHDRVHGRLPACEGDLVFRVQLSDHDFTHIQILASGVDVAVRERAYISLMRSVVAFLDEVDDAYCFQTEAEAGS